MSDNEDILMNTIDNNIVDQFNTNFFTKIESHPRRPAIGQIFTSSYDAPIVAIEIFLEKPIGQYKLKLEDNKQVLDVTYFNHEIIPSKHKIYFSRKPLLQKDKMYRFFVEYIIENKDKNKKKNIDVLSMYVTHDNAYIRGCLLYKKFNKSFKKQPKIDLYFKTFMSIE